MTKLSTKSDTTQINQLNLDYFDEVTGTISNRVIKNGNGDVFAWAKVHAPEMYREDERLFDAIETALVDDLDAFKKTVLAWGRHFLLMYKRFGDGGGSSEFGVRSSEYGVRSPKSKVQGQ